ncbi:hypothetical protein HD554DRAFT_2111111 [Boletus coccyginus]|nr:hypothetical protein HD554DRAFT_2111111 [Boletus coccyginus]
MNKDTQHLMYTARSKTHGMAPKYHAPDSDDTGRAMVSQATIVYVHVSGPGHHSVELGTSRRCVARTARVKVLSSGWFYSAEDLAFHLLLGIRGHGGDYAKAGETFAMNILILAVTAPVLCHSEGAAGLRSMAGWIHYCMGSTVHRPSVVINAFRRYHPNTNSNNLGLVRAVRESAPGHYAVSVKMVRSIA